MDTTLTERLTGNWTARKASGVSLSLPPDEWHGRNDRFFAENRHGTVFWVEFISPLREEDMSCRSTEIVFPETIEAPVPRTPLGKRLLALRVQAIKAGMKLLNADEVLEEVKRRRGEIEGDETDVY